VVTVSPTGVLTPVNVPGYTLSGPGAVTVDSTGDLFIADSNNARVLELKPTGNVVLIAGAPLLSYPASLAFDPAGDLYIGDLINLALYKVSASSLQTESGVTTPVTISNVSGLFPGALATDASGDLFIADGSSNNIYELPAGQTTAQNVTPAGFTLSSPSGLGFDAAGNWYVLDDGSNQYAYDGEGRICTVYNKTMTSYTSYAYDGLGNRVAKGGGANGLICDNNLTATSTFIMGPNGEQLDALNASGAAYSNVFANGHLLATYQFPSSSWTYALNDWLGTKRFVADAAGTQAETCTGLPFGDGMG
jgi:sugar lactone lactonase YvrE